MKVVEIADGLGVNSLRLTERPDRCQGQGKLYLR
jgi:hypothetical protein